MKTKEKEDTCATEYVGFSNTHATGSEGESSLQVEGLIPQSLELSAAGEYAMCCSSSKKVQIHEIILAYYFQLQRGCGKVECVNHLCRSSPLYEAALRTLSAEELFSKSVQLAKRTFQSSNIDSFFFCDNVAHPLHCFRIDVWSSEKLYQSAQEGTEALSEVLRRGISSLEHLLFSFPLCTKSTYVRESERMRAFGVPEEDQLGIEFSSMGDALKLTRSVSSSKWLPNLKETISQLTSFMLNPMYTMEPVQFHAGLYLTGVSLAVRAILVLFHIPALFDPTHEYNSCLHSLCSAIEDTEAIHYMLKVQFALLPQENFYSLVMNLQQYISVSLYNNIVLISEVIASATFVLALLYKANYLLPSHSTHGKISYEAFYNGAVNDVIDVRKDFLAYANSRQRSTGEMTLRGKIFTFAEHPFLLDLSYKSLLLHYHSRIEQQHEVQNTIHSLMAIHMLGGTVDTITQDDFALKIVVDREELLKTTLQELSSKSDKYKKPLRVHFKGEEGIDEGGVRKEFFQLLIKQIFDPEFGMFEETSNHYQWFRPHILCGERDEEFEFVGLLFGLAIYNSIILDVQFPLIIYQMLLGHKPDTSLDTLKRVDPELSAGLQTLLDFEENEACGDTVQNTFCRTFSESYTTSSGEMVEVELVNEGNKTSLTKENRAEYVDAYLKYRLSLEHQPHFKLFCKGFLSVCQNPMLPQIRPEELEVLIIGSPDLDFAVLQRNCKYDGYKKSDPTIVSFWEIVLHDMTNEDQRKLLKFCTGSDRVPIGGLGSILFVIGKNGGDSELLPTSHTCFNHLLLPSYRTKNKLREKLMQAINNCQGFGLM